MVNYFIWWEETINLINKVLNEYFVVDLSQSSKILTSKPATVSCLQNATDSCLYRWMKVQDGVLSTVTYGHTLTFMDVGDFMCEANCTIRGQLCIMHPISIEFRLEERHGEEL